jgi:hypothetical protein
MTDLSPAAQAVLNASSEAPVGEGWNADRLAIAAALRAVANQVVPPHLETELYDRNPSLTLQKAVEIRHQLLTIAAELENTHG